MMAVARTQAAADCASSGVIELGRALLPPLHLRAAAVTGHAWPTCAEGCCLQRGSVAGCATAVPRCGSAQRSWACAGARAAGSAGLARSSDKRRSIISSASAVALGTTLPECSIARRSVTTVACAVGETWRNHDSTRSRFAVRPAEPITACRWMEAGKFLTGFSAVGLVAVPAILAHAEYITFGAMLIELCAAASIGLMVVVYDYSRHDSYSSFY